MTSEGKKSIKEGKRKERRGTGEEGRRSRKRVSGTKDGHDVGDKVCHGDKV